MISIASKFYDRLVLAYPVAWLAVVVLIVVISGLHIKDFKLDASADSLVLENDDDLRYHRKISKLYGSDDFLVIFFFFSWTAIRPPFNVTKPTSYPFSAFTATKSPKDLVRDFVSIEEPLEMNLKYKVDSKWITEHLSITMRTPGHDEDLISGFLFNERIIENFSEIENVKKIGEKVGDFNIQNKIVATINNAKNIDIGKIKKNFITNSSCGVCGKTSLETVEVIKKDKLNISFPKIQKIYAT